MERGQPEVAEVRGAGATLGSQRHRRGVRKEPSLSDANRSNGSFRSLLGKGRQPIETIGIVRKFVACPAEPHLSSQIPQDFSRVPVFLRL